MSEIVRFAPEDEERVRVDAAFAAVAEILTKPREAGGLEINNELAEAAGSDDFYCALIAGSEAFIQQYPDIYKHRAPSPYVMGLWIGLVVGARAAQEA